MDSALPLDKSGMATGTTVTTDSSPLKFAGLMVNRGSLFAAAMLAIMRSATRPRGLRPQIQVDVAVRSAGTPDEPGVPGHRGPAGPLPRGMFNPLARTG